MVPAMGRMFGPIAEWVPLLFFVLLVSALTLDSIMARVVGMILTNRRLVLCRTYPYPLQRYTRGVLLDVPRSQVALQEFRQDAPVTLVLRFAKAGHPPIRLIFQSPHQPAGRAISDALTRPESGDSGFGGTAQVPDGLLR
jgi:hypothetical protein